MPPPQSTAHENAVSAQVAVDAAGDEIVVWALGGGSDGQHWAVQAAVRPAAATRFGAPQQLSVAGQNQDPRVAEDQAGDAIAVWQHVDGSGAFVDAASLPVGASAWSAAELAGAADPASPRVALDAAGDAVAVWNDSSSVNQTVGTAYRTGRQKLQHPGSLSRPGSSATDPHVALDQAGQTYAVWLGTDGTHWIVEGFLPDPPPGPGPPIGPPPVSGCTPHPGLPPCPPQTLARIPPGGGTPSLSALRVSPSTFATAGRVVAGHCVGVTRANRAARLYPADRAEGQPQAHRLVDRDVHDQTRRRRPTSREAVRRVTGQSNAAAAHGCSPCMDGSLGTATPA